ncbi:hypothetical protein [Nocardioides conyzicola]|uniref:Uncharacterized protein n=1 Tax=Nocardioides conyzicola TaxID=1651781 RepID=A0ABP8Y3T4_9ACTN
MWIWIVVAVVVVAAGVYAFWPRADHLGSRVNRASAIAQGRAENYDNEGGGGYGGP